MNGLKSFWGDQNFANVSNGIIDGLAFGIIAIPLIQKAAASANLAPELLNSWLVTVYVGGGIISLIMALYYKLPIVGAWSIPGAFALAQVMGNFTFNETVGGFLTAGLIVFLLGITGTIKQLVRRIPTQIMMAMVAGTLFGWASKLIGAFKTAPVISFVGLLGYVVCKRFLKKIPAVVGTMVFTLIAAAVMGKLQFTGLDFGVAKPVFILPAFNGAACLSIGVPLALLVVCAENMQAIGVQIAIGKKPPVNGMTIISGIGGLIAPFFGGHNCNIAGPMTAWAGSEDCGPVEKRYVAAVWCGIIFAITGILAPLTMSVLGMLPGEATTVIIGLTLVSMIIGGLEESFGSGKFKFGSFASFAVAMSGIVVLQIGSAFWALVVGTAISLLLEKKDYDEMKSPLD
ncbi:MAG: benzoate/H(+) symporter BenE family transporter [Synergistaceae bacterium]|nr:benzoate/H(+) symporter BenE family transporter [Synergistaceae bacterium]